MKTGKIQITPTPTLSRPGSTFSKSIYPYIVQATQYIVDLGYFDKLLSSEEPPGSLKPKTKNKGSKSGSKRRTSGNALPPGNILIVLGSDQDMIRLKNLFWGKQETSDVVSFHYPENKDPAIEILINVDQAKRRKPDDWNLEKETVFLYIHGILHCLGWDDKTKHQRQVMLNLGEKILNHVWP